MLYSKFIEKMELVWKNTVFTMMWIYLTLLECIIKSKQDGKFYVFFTITQKKNKKQLT